MNTRCTLPGIMLCVLVCMAPKCLAQEPRIVMPGGQVNKPYSESILSVLEEEYEITTPLKDWTLVGPAPTGFGLERSTGRIFGTSTTAETHLFRVQALDRSQKGRPVVHKFLIAIQITAPVPDESETAAQRQAKAQTETKPDPPLEQQEQVVVHNQDEGAKPTPVQVKHSGMVFEKDAKTYVRIVAAREVDEISIAAFEKAEDGKFTKSVGEVKAPTLSRNKDEYLVEVPLATKGVTKVTVKGSIKEENKDEKTVESSIEINKLVASNEKSGDKAIADTPAADPKKLVIVKPANKSDIEPIDGSIEVYVKAPKDSGITKIRYQVRNGAAATEFKELTVKPTADKDDETHFRVRVIEGTNTIEVINPDDDKNKVEIQYICKSKCASSFKTAEFAGSQNSRAIVGFEQAGASSASSETKPFIDFFFSTPFWFTGNCGDKPKAAHTAGSNQTLEEYNRCMRDRPPRMAVWGNVRVGATPDQIAAVGVLPSNFANTFGDPRNTVDLVQSFDFLMGLETRLFTANGRFLSLIPGLPQKTRFYVAGGGGAISPLNTRRELAQIFKIPAKNTPQRDDFISRFGTPPDSDPAKEFVGLVPLDRDRFLRQWYAGIRLKTFYCHNDECTEFENTFPSQVDVMVGQSEAVTGGSLFYLKPDPNDPTRNIKKRSFVLRFDAFYPFPLQRANFLYFYGAAIMKIGAGGVRIQNPLFLDRAADDVQITDPRVYIPPSDLQKLFQPSRDYYKLGMGIDLIGLINRFTK